MNLGNLAARWPMPYSGSMKTLIEFVFEWMEEYERHEKAARKIVMDYLNERELELPANYGGFQ